ncbi:GtrA family protein [Vagococcus zengguangii]|uniref:GtrA family protein n=1 Tax=Vagococcus zengguangii TaxID=2571750 RepID=A0A4D7CV56_9ENTE|nr:GtrA family protein [Vagococcus zengguangii]QCI87032.1 GtrA family protein [Vagococcus zengguangii]
MNKLGKYYQSKLKEIINYLIFGVLTTIVNLIVYFGLTKLTINYGIANTIAWIISVLFAYVTNKCFVFKATGLETKQLVKELTAFFSVRLFSYVMDMLVLYLCLSVLKWPPVLAKLISQVVVVILNYLFSKIFVFKED